MKRYYVLIFLTYLLIVLLLFGPKLMAQGSISGDSAAFYLKLAQVDKQNGRRLDMLKKLDKALTFHTADPATLQGMGEMLSDLRKYVQAMEKFDKAIAINSNDTILLRQTLMMAFQLQLYDRVIEVASMLKKVDPKASVGFYLGKIYYQMDDYGRAIGQLTQAAKENPTLAEIPYLLAKCYADMTNFKAAIPYFIQALVLNPNQPQWAYELGLSYYAVQDDVNALTYIQRAAAVGYKKDNDYMENLSIAYLNVGMSEDGIVILKEALGRRPVDLNLLNLMGEAHYDQGKFTEAMQYWDRILEQDKTNASSLYMIGMCYQKMGGNQVSKGISLCDRAIQMDPSLPSLKQKKMTAGL